MTVSESRVDLVENHRPARISIEQRREMKGETDGFNDGRVARDEY